MERKVELGLRGPFIPKFFNREYINQHNQPGTNPWLTARNLHSLPVNPPPEVYRSLINVITRKEKDIAKMKDAIAANDATMRQKRKEFTVAPSKFPDNAEKKRLQTKAREGDPSFTVKMYVVSGEETAEQGVLWLKKFDETFLTGRTLTGPMYLKLYNHLQALTKDEALQVVTSSYSKMKAIAELVPEDDNEFETTIFKTDN